MRIGNLKTAVLTSLLVFAACGGNGGEEAEEEEPAGDNGIAAACEYIVENQDGVDPTPEEVEEVKRLADDPEFERTYETLVELNSETPDGPSMANLGAFAEQASKLRASCANAGVVIPQGEASE